MDTISKKDVVGSRVGRGEGIAVDGLGVGGSDGAAVGDAVGDDEGAADGSDDGAADGDDDGDDEGAADGDDVGEPVGACEYDTWKSNEPEIDASSAHATVIA
jgi:hypothetical protein